VANVIASMHELPTEITIGWILWLAWAAAQVIWYRRARTAIPAVQLAAPPRMPRRAAEPGGARPETASGPALSRTDVSTAAEDQSSRTTETTQADSAADVGTASARRSILGLADVS
jgi:hypothetical protein